MKIPKKLHYVWVGKNPIPERVKNIMKSNEQILGSEWKIKIWTEKDFDISSNPFTKYWYEKKQWAFVSDYIRAYAVNKEGGFYIDTDIKLSKSLDKLLNTKYVASRTYVVENTMSIFGSIPNNKILAKYMEVMSHKNLINKPPKIMSTDIHTYAIRKYFDIPNENSNYINSEISIYTEDILQIAVNNNNVAIHEHHDNWTGNDEPTISKYYDKKIKSFNSLTNITITKLAKQRDKKMKTIDKLMNK